MSISTQHGDAGETSLPGRPRISKSGLRVDAYGTIELAVDTRLLDDADTGPSGRVHGSHRERKSWRHLGSTAVRTNESDEVWNVKEARNNVRTI